MSLLIALSLLTSSPAWSAAVLTFRSDAPIHLYVDGQKAASTTLGRSAELTLDPGAHTLRLESITGRVLHSGRVELEDNTALETRWYRRSFEVMGAVKLPGYHEAAAASTAAEPEERPAEAEPDGAVMIGAEASLHESDGAILIGATSSDTAPSAGAALGDGTAGEGEAAPLALSAGAVAAAEPPVPVGTAAEPPVPAEPTAAAPVPAEPTAAAPVPAGAPALSGGAAVPAPALTGGASASGAALPGAVAGGAALPGAALPGAVAGGAALPGAAAPASTPAPAAQARATPAPAGAAAAVGAAEPPGADRDGVASAGSAPLGETLTSAAVSLSDDMLYLTFRRGNADTPLLGIAISEDRVVLTDGLGAARFAMDIEEADDDAGLDPDAPGSVLFFTRDGRWANIYIDGEVAAYIANDAQASLALEPGTYEVEIRDARGKEVWHRGELTVEGGKSLEIGFARTLAPQVQGAEGAWTPLADESARR